MPIVYIDVLFFTNLLFDILLLILTAGLCCRKPGGIRTLLGGLTGAISGTAIFFLQVNHALSVLLSVSTAVLMLSAVFFPFTKSEFLRLVSCFYLSSFLMSGGLSAIFFFSGNPAIMSNGICYFPVSLPKLAALALPVAAALCLSWKKAKSRLNFHRKYCNVILSFEGNTLRLEGLIDTGCSLVDPSTRLPAIIIDCAAAKKLCPSSYIYPRTIPFSTIHSSTGHIPSFTPDKCVIITDSQINDCACCVAVSSVNLNGKAIINPEILLNWRKKYELPNLD